MNYKARLEGFSVTRKGLSIKLVCERAEDAITSLGRVRDWLRLDDVSLLASVKSVNLREGGNRLLLRAEHDRSTVNKLDALLEKDACLLSFETDRETLGTDIGAVHARYASLTPLMLDRTSEPGVAALSLLLGDGGLGILRPANSTTGARRRISSSN